MDGIPSRPRSIADQIALEQDAARRRADFHPKTLLTASAPASGYVPSGPRRASDGSSRAEYENGATSRNGHAPLHYPNGTPDHRDTLSRSHNPSASYVERVPHQIHQPQPKKPYDRPTDSSSLQRSTSSNKSSDASARRPQHYSISLAPKPKEKPSFKPIASYASPVIESPTLPQPSISPPQPASPPKSPPKLPEDPLSSLLPPPDLRTQSFVCSYDPALDRDPVKKSSTRQLQYASGERVSSTDPRMDRDGNRMPPKTKISQPHLQAVQPLNYEFDGHSTSAPPPPAATSICISGLSTLTTIDQIVRHFSNYGRIAEHELVIDTKTGGSMGVCRLKFVDEALRTTWVKDSMGYSARKQGKPGGVDGALCALKAVQKANGLKIGAGASLPGDEGKVTVVLDIDGKASREACRIEYDRRHKRKSASSTSTVPATKSASPSRSPNVSMAMDIDKDFARSPQRPSASLTREPVKLAHEHYSNGHRSAVEVAGPSNVGNYRVIPSWREDSSVNHHSMHLDRNRDYSTFKNVPSPPRPATSTSTSNSSRPHPQITPPSAVKMVQPRTSPTKTTTTLLKNRKGKQRATDSEDEDSDDVRSINNNKDRVYFPRSATQGRRNSQPLAQITPKHGDGDWTDRQILTRKLAENGNKHIVIAKSATAVVERAKNIRFGVKDIFEHLGRFTPQEVLEDVNNWYCTFAEPDLARRCNMVLNRKPFMNIPITLTVHDPPQLPKSPDKSHSAISPARQSARPLSEEELLREAREIILADLKEAFIKDLKARIVPARIKEALDNQGSSHPLTARAGPSLQASPASPPKRLDKLKTEPAVGTSTARLPSFGKKRNLAPSPPSPKADRPQTPEPQNGAIEDDRMSLDGHGFTPPPRDKLLPSPQPQPIPVEAPRPATPESDSEPEEALSQIVLSNKPKPKPQKKRKTLETLRAKAINFTSSEADSSESEDEPLSATLPLAQGPKIVKPKKKSGGRPPKKKRAPKKKQAVAKVKVESEPEADVLPEVEDVVVPKIEVEAQLGAPFEQEPPPSVDIDIKDAVPMAETCVQKIEAAEDSDDSPDEILSTSVRATPRVSESVKPSPRRSESVKPSPKPSQPILPVAQQVQPSPQQLPAAIPIPQQQHRVIPSPQQQQRTFVSPQRHPHQLASPQRPFSSPQRPFPSPQRPIPILPNLYRSPSFKASPERLPPAYISPQPLHGSPNLVAGTIFPNPAFFLPPSPVIPEPIQTSPRLQFTPRSPTRARSPTPDPFSAGLAQDDEDLYYLRVALERLKTGNNAEPPAKPTDIEAEIYAHQHYKGRIHETGSARTDGFYKIATAEKLLYLPSRNKTTTTTQATTQTSSKAASRLARVNARNLVHGIDGKKAEGTDLLQFNQLRTRKKQLRFARSPIHDWGLYSMEYIPANEMVIEYVGEIIRQQVADRREQQYERMGIGSSYLFRVDDDLVVDATKKGNLGRLINHCCTPNCTAKIITVGGEKKIVIFAKIPIEPGDEVTYDYHFPIEQEKIPCLCGSAGCRGTLN